MKFGLLTIAVAMIAVGCKKAGINDEVRHLGKFENAVEASELADTIMMIPLSEEGSYMLGGIDQMQFYDDRWYVLDSDKRNAFFVFDRRGAGMSFFDKQGRGPGEYLVINNFDINPESGDILLLCGPPKIIILDNGLQYKSEIDLDKFYERAVWTDDGILLYSHQSSDVSFLDSGSGELKKVFSAQGDKDNAFRGSPVFYRNGDKLYFHFAGLEHLYEIDGMEFIPVMSLDYPDMERANALYREKGFAAMTPEEIFDNPRPVILSLYGKDGISIVYRYLINGMNMDLGNGQYRNVAFGHMPGTDRLVVNADGMLAGWCFPFESDENMMKTYLGDIVIDRNTSDGANFAESGNPVLVVYKLKKT